jgi:hypothetical protein
MAVTCIEVAAAQQGGHQNRYIFIQVLARPARTFRRLLTALPGMENASRRQRVNVHTFQRFNF